MSLCAMGRSILVVDDEPPVAEAFADPNLTAVARRTAEKGLATVELGPGVDAGRSDDGPRLVVRARRSPLKGTWLVIEDVTQLRRLLRIRSEFIDNPGP